MCGIIGYIATSKAIKNDIKDHFLRFALVMDTLRGQDSTGLMSVYRGFKVHAYKAAVPGYKFVANQEYETLNKFGWCTVGHNRAATAGTVTRENAHPFIFGGISLVHNGTLWGKGYSVPGYDASLPVDSMQIARALSEVAPGEADDMLEKIDGSFALAWFDKRDQTINLARNNERPLHFTVNKERNFMMFMSDGNMLQSINRSLGDHFTRGETVFSLDPHRHLKFQYGNLVPEVTKFRPFVRPVYTPAVSHGVHRGSGAVTTTPSGTTSTSRAPTNGTSGATLRDATECSIDALKRKWAARENVVYPDFTKRITTEHHLKALEFYMLEPTQVLRFIPKDGFQVSSHVMRVRGEVYHPDWMCMTEATINNVPLVQWSAYASHDWLVRPIGVAAPHTYEMHKMPSILCQLLDCKKSFDAKDRDFFPPEIAERRHLTVNKHEKDLKDGDLIKGPGGVLMPVMKVRKLLDDHEVCINCTMPLVIDKASDYEFVNEGRDLVCGDCKWNYNGV